MKLAGIELNDVEPMEIPTTDYGMYEEGKRTKVKFLWVYTNPQEPDGNGYGFAAYKLTMTNYGSIALDGTPIKDPKDIDQVNMLFSQIHFGGGSV